MKRILSLILAALLLSSALVSCSGGEAKETLAETVCADTDGTETAPSETEDGKTFAYDPDLITENGIAKAKIVLSPTASELENYAAEELAYHIQKVSGAVVETVTESPSDCLSIVIGTPDTVPALCDLFAEDIDWLSDLEEDGKVYGDDGFAIRNHEGKLYIFGVNARGALNGVYDFIEETMGVLWVRAYEDIGLIYEEMPTITLTNTDYASGHREKSPFQIRGWTAGGLEYEPGETITQMMFTRNKMNTAYTAPYDEFRYRWVSYEDRGLTPFPTSENIKWWLTHSPLYDESVTEFWNTDANGNPMTADTSPQVNYLSDLTADAVAASVIAVLDQYTPEVDLKYMGVCVADTYAGTWLYEREDFEYAPGEFVSPSEKEYLSTIFFTFINKVAKQVGEKYPDISILTYAYDFALLAPKCELEENVIAVFCPVEEDMTDPLTDTTNLRNESIYRAIEDWRAKTDRVVFYNYYGCFIASTHYTRPVWDRIQADMQYYAERGFLGLMSEGIIDTMDYLCSWSRNDMSKKTSVSYRDKDGNMFSCGDIWSINALTFWLYGKLMWNPYEDVDALIKEFCDKCYGEASPYMQEYYFLLEGGFHEGKESDVMTPTMRVEIPWATPLETYIESFIDNYDLVEYADLPDRLITALNNAWEAADDMEKERIRLIKEQMEYIVYYIENLEFPY